MCVETFLVEFNTCAKYNDWDAEDKAAHLKTALIGGAGLLLWEMQEATYEPIVEKLRQRYGYREQQEMFRTELKYRRRKPAKLYKSWHSPSKGSRHWRVRLPTQR